MTPETYRPEMPLTDLAENYIAENPRARSVHTHSIMRGCVRTFEMYLGKPATLADLTAAGLIAYSKFRELSGRSPRTTERDQSKLATLWRWAATRGWCAAPMFSVVKCKPPTPTAYSRKEMKQLFAGASRYKAPIGKLPGGLVMSAMLLLCYDTGERSNALLKVKWSDLNMPDRWATFRGETRKGGIKASDNVQRFSRKTRKALLALERCYQSLGLESEMVFPQLERTSIYYHMRTLLASIGLPSDRRSMFHKIRRTHATHLYIQGGDPTASLGHDSDAMTRGYYLDPRYVRGGHLADYGSGLFGLASRVWRRLKVACGIW